MPDYSQDVQLDMTTPVDAMALIIMDKTQDTTNTLTNPNTNQDWYGAEILWDSIISSGSNWGEHAVFGLFTIAQTILQTEILDNPDYDTDTAGQIIEFVNLTFNVLNSFRYLDQNKNPITFSSRDNISSSAEYAADTDTLLLVEFEGSSFTDSSTYAHTISTQVGSDYIISTDTSKYGASSLKKPISFSSDDIWTSQSVGVDKFSLTNDLTIECFIYLVGFQVGAGDTGEWLTLFHRGGAINQNPPYLASINISLHPMNATQGAMWVHCRKDTFNASELDSTGVLFNFELGKWKHYAFVWDASASLMSMYYEKALIGSVTLSYAPTAHLTYIDPIYFCTLVRRGFYADRYKVTQQALTPSEFAYDREFPIVFSSRPDPNQPIIFRSPGGIRYNINKTNTLANPNNNDDASNEIPTLSATKNQSLISINQTKNATTTNLGLNIGFKVGGEMVIFVNPLTLTSTLPNPFEIITNSDLKIILEPLTLTSTVNRAFKTS